MEKQNENVRKANAELDKMKKIYYVLSKDSVTG